MWMRRAATPAITNRVQSAHGKTDFPERHYKPEQDGTQGKWNEALNAQDTRKCTGIDAINPTGTIPGFQDVGCGTLSW